MAGVWIKLKTIKNIDVQGKLKKFVPGDWVQVGKQIAVQWYLAGEAESPDLDKMFAVLGEKPPRSQKKRKKYPPPKPHPVDKAKREQMRYDLEKSRWMPRIPQTVTEKTLTLFGIPMSFQGREKMKQHNAIGSWTRLSPQPIIFLFGNEPGIEEAALKMGCVPMPRIERNKYGTPLVGDAFMQMQRLVAPGDVICYVNCDIILLQDWADAVHSAASKFKDNFLMVGERWDTDIGRPLDFDGGWILDLQKEVAVNGQLHGVGAIDYFVFRSGLYEDIPPFAIGRSAWDNWLVAYVIDKGVPVINASYVATAIHQEKGSTPAIMTETRITESTRNKNLRQDSQFGCAGKINQADFWIHPSGKIKSCEP